ncbi:MAG TPA: hypothetical protein VK901_02870 [Nitrospiraceae bacterium]|nr:hypothetical protein [Nitrospiraceae bacterium]
MLKHLFMTLEALTTTFDLATPRAGNRRRWMRAMTLSLVVAGAFLLQGCLAGAWVAAVAVDTMKSSHMTFWPFEQSWVAPRDQSSDAVPNSKVTSVAVLPVKGDPEMGARLATVLQQETTLRVESPATVEAGVTKTDPRSAQADDADRSALAKEITRDLGVDTVLVSRVAGSPAHSSDWGSNAEGSRRLYLYLVNHDGQLLWKDELPFTLVQGFNPPLEASVQADLSQHMMQQVKALHLDELGYLPKKIS